MVLGTMLDGTGLEGVKMLDSAHRAPGITSLGLHIQIPVPGRVDDCNLILKNGRADVVGIASYMDVADTGEHRDLIFVT